MEEQQKRQLMCNGLQLKMVGLKLSENEIAVWLRLSANELAIIGTGSQSIFAGSL